MSAHDQDPWLSPVEAGLYFVPTGQLCSFDRYKNFSTMPARIRSLPVLQGNFNASSFNPKSGLPQYFGWGTVQIADIVALTFRMQIGPNMVYWLADIADPEVKEAMSKWEEAKTIVVAAEFDDGTVALVKRDYDIHPLIKKLMSDRALQRPSAFGRAVGMAIKENHVKAFARTDLSAFPCLQNVQACMVCTQRTLPYAVISVGACPESDDELARAVRRALSCEQIEGKTRH